jgi:lysophospholipase L1-like esterase
VKNHFLPNDNRVQWIGRTFAKAGHVIAAFPGVSCRLRLESESAIAVIEASTNDCHIRLNDQKLRLKQGRNEVVLPSNEEVEIFRCTESWQGVLTFVEFIVDGEMRAIEPRKRPKLLFIGDSITCGAATLLQHESQLNDSAVNDAYFSFGMMLARRIEAEAHLVSYGGRGLYRDWQGLTSAETNNAPEYFERALPDDPSALWDHNQYQPDAVLICLGTNDFHLGIPPVEIWRKIFVLFIQRIQTLHPQSKVILISSPMTNEPERKKALLRILRIVAEQTNSQMIEIAFYPGSGVDSHPTADQHEQIANEIEPILRQCL